MTAYEEQSQIDELQRLLKKAQGDAARNKRRTDDIVQAIYQAAYEAAKASGRGHVVKRPAVDKRRKGHEVALVHATDWQLGKKTASYNIAVADRRIAEFTDKIISLTDIQRKDHPVDECVLMLGGDMVEGGGNVFASQVWEIEAHLFDQLFETARIIERMVRTLQANFAKPIRVVCEWGNHGRLGRYGDGTYAGDNADRMAYRIAEDRCKDIPATWQHSDAWYQQFAIGKYRVLLVHGDEIKSFGGGVPAFGIARKTNAWATGVIPDFDDVYLGHFHQNMCLTLANGGRCFVSGSIESDSEYAKEFVAATGKPSQRLHFVNPDKGQVTAEYVVWLT
jgi:DNA repair exonuclease SbcCD nuclease subunit